MCLWSSIFSVITSLLTPSLPIHRSKCTHWRSMNMGWMTSWWWGQMGCGTSYPTRTLPRQSLVFLPTVALTTSIGMFYVPCSAHTTVAQLLTDRCCGQITLTSLLFGEDMLLTVSCCNYTHFKSIFWSRWRACETSNVKVPFLRIPWHDGWFKW